MNKKAISVFISTIVLGMLITLFYVLSKSSSPDLSQTTSSATPSLIVTTLAPLLPIHTIGQITRHASNFIGQTVKIEGYMLISDKTYVIFSDENGGTIGIYDLPVTGPGIEQLVFKKKYILQGKFVSGGLNASNKNPNHFELSIPPQLAQ